MMFEYDEEEDRGEVVAELYEFSGDPELCLCVKAQSGKFIWFYHNSMPIIQRSGFSGNDPIKKFYRGDKITITF